MRAVRTFQSFQGAGKRIGEEQDRDRERKREGGGFIFPSPSRQRYTESGRKREGSFPLVLYEPKLVHS